MITGSSHPVQQTWPAGSDTSAPSHASDKAICESLLPKVSRTFALGIGLLPTGLEYSVLIAYLLCRIADTIEDTTLLDPVDKVRLLKRFRSCVADEQIGVQPLRQAFSQSTTDDERLTRDADVVLREFRRLPAPHRDAIAPRVREMCDGMAEFAGRARRASDHGLSALATLDDLDRYCYYVAGTVGQLLTDLFRQHYPSLDPKRYTRLQSLATSFGLGLQLTNIIKDVADDRRRGWSFVPHQLCQIAGIRPEDVQSDAHRVETQRVMSLLIAKAKRHLCDALEYCTALPRHQYRFRLFCLTPLYLAVRTLRRAEHHRGLVEPDYKVKITRPEVRRTVVATRTFAPINAFVRSYFRRLAGPEWWQQCHSCPSASG